MNETINKIGAIVLGVWALNMFFRGEFTNAFLALILSELLVLPYNLNRP